MTHSRRGAPTLSRRVPSESNVMIQGICLCEEEGLVKRFSNVHRVRIAS